jgi:hypothetical protein
MAKARTKTRLAIVNIPIEDYALVHMMANVFFDGNIQKMVCEIISRWKEKQFPRKRTASCLAENSGPFSGTARECRSSAVRFQMKSSRSGPFLSGFPVVRTKFLCLGRLAGGEGGIIAKCGSVSNQNNGVCNRHEIYTLRTAKFHSAYTIAGKELFSA